MAETETPASKSAAPIRPPASNFEAQKPRQEHKAHWWIWAIVLTAVAGIALLVILRRRQPPEHEQRPTVVSTTNATTGDIDVSVTALGTVTPVYTAGISPRVDGQIVSVNYDEGQMVKTNDLLAEIDPAPYIAVLVQGQGMLARDNAQLDAARIDLQRYQAAYDKKAIPQQQVADQEALVRQNEGTVKLDQGTVSNAQVQVDYCYIRAPINGRAGLRLIDPGNVVHAANTNALVVITQLQPITVLFSVAEDYLPQIMAQLKQQHPMRVEAYDRALEKKIAVGTFLTMDNLIDTSTGTIRIKAVFPNDDFNLFPNQFVNAKLIIDTLRNVTLVPTADIQRNPQGAFVYVLTNGPAGSQDATNKFVAMQPITTGVSDTNLTSVEGVEPGTVIVADNFSKLEDGARVILRDQMGRQRGQHGRHGHDAEASGDDSKKPRKKDQSQEDAP